MRMDWLVGTCAIAAICVAPATAQDVTLSVGTGAAQPGMEARVDISVSSTAGKEPAGLQWTLDKTPSDILSIAHIVGPAAIAAGKTQISCNETATKAECVLVGLNTNTIANGVVATAIIGTAPGWTVDIPVGISGVVAVDAAGSGLSATGTPGAITLGTGPCDLDGDGVSTVIDVQRIINASLTGGCRVGP